MARPRMKPPVIVTVRGEYALVHADATGAPIVIRDTYSHVRKVLTKRLNVIYSYRKSSNEIDRRRTRVGKWPIKRLV